MKGTTNSKLLTALKEIVQLNLITNQNSSSDLVGATITVEYGGEVKNHTWDGNQINIEIPEGWEYTISVGDVSDYQTPSPVTFTSEGNSVTNVNMQYLTELVTITVTTEDGTSTNGSIINCNGTNHTYNGVFTKKFAYGTTYTITPNNFGDYSTDPITYTANQVSREISIVYSLGLPAGTTYEFEYTGTVQEITLPKGSYKLQCWGAQGGDVTGTYAVSGSKGGYSEGVLSLSGPTTLYVLVGGKGQNYTSSATQTSETIIKGGWNGGGAGLRTNYSSFTRYKRYIFPRGGGGATDISTVGSTISYSNGRTVRDQTSLLSRFIVAGGGAGACADHTILDGWFQEGNVKGGWISPGQEKTYTFNVNFEDTYRLSMYGNDKSIEIIEAYISNSTGEILKQIEDPTGGFTSMLSQPIVVTIKYNDDTAEYEEYATVTLERYRNEEHIYKSTQQSQGGGTTGKGSYVGMQSSAGDYAEFGLGANADDGGYDKVSAAGGGGWYGGGTYYKNNIDLNLTDSCGGGSGFVNTSANAKYRPTGYTGLQLVSGTTIAGNTSFKSPTGVTETGHSGNGYARITVL